jgi:hypothetical protein
VWANEYKLQEHELSREHNRKQKFLRRMDQEAAARDPRIFVCPYGTDENQCKSYKNRNKLIEHIRKSTVANTSASHDQAKTADGWYDEDWEYDMAKMNPTAHRQQLARGGNIYSAEAELPEGTSLAIDSKYHVVEGAGGHGGEIPAMYQGIVFSGDTHGISQTLHRQVS